MEAPFIKLSTHSSDSVDSNLSEPRNSPESLLSPRSTEASSPPSSPPPEPNTHNTSRAKYHVKDIKEFAQALEISADRALPNHGRFRYTSTKVLLLRWEEDHLNVAGEIEYLEKVLKDYGFDTEIWKIPTESPDRKILRKALDFIDDNEDEDTLLIVYYGGHATINQARQATWSCTRDWRYSSFEWNGCQRLFEKSKSDVLLLLDCCSAAAAATASTPARTNSVTEIIAACGWETWAPNPGCLSFTNALIAVLQDRQTPFSAAMLHSEVLAVLKQPRPRRGFEKHSKTPVYVLSASDPKTCSIEIARRANTYPINPDPPVAAKMQISNDLDASSPLMTPSDKTTFDPKAFITTLPDNNFVLPHVIISVALETDQELDVRSFAQWIRQFPALAQYAKIQGVYRGYSTLVLAALPVVIWNLLPENPAYNFVGYARSDNLLYSKKIQKPINLKSTEVFTGAPAVPQSSRSKNDVARSGVSAEHNRDSGSQHALRARDGSNPHSRRFASGTDNLTELIEQALRKNAHLPTKNWALAAVLENGIEQTYTSRGLASHRTRLFSPRFKHDFHRYVQGSYDSYPNSGYSSDISSASTLFFGPSRYRTGSIDSHNSEQCTENDSSSPSTSSSKHRPQSTSSSVSTEDFLSTLSTSDLSDSQELESLYSARFNGNQQSAFRQLARAFVELIGPEKGLHHKRDYIIRLATGS